MRRSLSNSGISLLLTGFVFFACSGRTAQEKTDLQKKQDPAGKNISAPGNPVNSGQTNTANPGRDSVLRNKTAIMNNDRNQAYTDSIKDAKTKKKK